MRDRQSGTASAGGGTNTALPGRVPPIHTCERRTSPGVLPRPRGCVSSTLCISHSRRVHSGSPPRSFFRPRSSAATQRLTSRASSTGTPGCSSISYSSRSAQRGLRALDLRRKHRLLAHETVEQQRRIRQQGGDGVEPPERDQCGVETPAQRRATTRTGGCGGSGAGTNALNGSPAVETVT